jgi:carbon monoxide dehydrogenase subunit G
MDLKNTFDVPLSPDRTWKVLLDIKRIAPCMPGAELVEVVDPQTYKGKVSVRLGPVALSFNGIAKFVEIVEAEHRARVEALGTDAKGRGGANAQVTFRLEPAGSGTKVTVDTQLNLSGSVAQYGRGAGMIQSVAGQLIGQFAKNLEANLEAELASTPEPAPATTTSIGQAPAVASVASAPAAPRPTPAPAKPISGFALVFGALWASLRGLFGGKPSSSHDPR